METAAAERNLPLSASGGTGIPKPETDELLSGTNGTAIRGKDKARLINPHLVLLKLSLFLVFGATSSLVPYLTVHMQSIGLTVGEIATVYLTLLLTTCLSPPLTGYVVDRFGQYKPVLLVSLALNMAAHHSLDLVPRRQHALLVPIQVQLEWRTNGMAGIQDNPCDLKLCPGLMNVQNNSEQCISTVTNIQLQSLKPNETCGELLVNICDEGEMNETWTKIIKCPNRSEYDQTFWYYLLVRFIASTMLSASLTLTDPVALAMIEQYGGDFGREKLFSSVGMAIFTPLTGLLIDYYSVDHNNTNYEPAFLTYDLLLSLSLISVAFLPVGKKLPSESILKHLFQILKYPHVLAFVFFLFFLGSFWGFIESYLFVIMKEMGSPNYLLGLTYTVGTVASIPMMYLTGPITRLVGHVNLLVVAFFAHALRILGYSFIDNPFWCFPIELNEGISCYFMWVVATTYCAVLAPNSLVATLIGVAGMVHFCLGKGIGSFFGGFLIAQYGTRMAFRYTGYIAVCCGIAYKMLHLLWLRKYDKLKPVEKDEQELKNKQ